MFCLYLYINLLNNKTQAYLYKKEHIYTKNIAKKQTKICIETHILCKIL